MKYVKLDDLKTWKSNHIQSGEAQSFDDMQSLGVFIQTAETIEIVHCKECIRYMGGFCDINYLFGAKWCSLGEGESDE